MNKITIITSLLVTSLLVGACKKKDDMPPPIAQGKCLVKEYQGSLIERQTCLFGGYSWTCEHTESGSHCVRRGPQSAEDTLLPVDASPSTSSDAAPPAVGP